MGDGALEIKEPHPRSRPSHIRAHTAILHAIITPIYKPSQLCPNQLRDPNLGSPLILGIVAETWRKSDRTSPESRHAKIRNAHVEFESLEDATKSVESGSTSHIKDYQSQHHGSFTPTLQACGLNHPDVPTAIKGRPSFFHDTTTVYPSRLPTSWQSCHTMLHSSPLQMTGMLTTLSTWAKLGHAKTRFFADPSPTTRTKMELMAFRYRFIGMLWKLETKPDIKSIFEACYLSNGVLFFPPSVPYGFAKTRATRFTL